MQWLLMTTCHWQGSRKNSNKRFVLTVTCERFSFQAVFACCSILVFWPLSFWAPPKSWPRFAFPLNFIFIFDEEFYPEGWESFADSVRKIQAVWQSSDLDLHALFNSSRKSFKHRSSIPKQDLDSVDRKISPRAHKYATKIFKVAKIIWFRSNPSKR